MGQVISSKDAGDERQMVGPTIGEGSRRDFHAVRSNKTIVTHLEWTLTTLTPGCDEE